MHIKKTRLTTGLRRAGLHASKHLLAEATEGSLSKTFESCVIFRVPPPITEVVGHDILERGDTVPLEGRTELPVFDHLLDHLRSLVSTAGTPTIATADAATLLLQRFDDQKKLTLLQLIHLSEFAFRSSLRDRLPKKSELTLVLDLEFMELLRTKLRQIPEPRRHTGNREECHRKNRRSHPGSEKGKIAGQKQWKCYHPERHLGVHTHLTGEQLIQLLEAEDIVIHLLLDEVAQ